MRTVIMLFTRDLRVHDNPALDAAVRTADEVVPLFVLDRTISVGRNRQRFLAESLTDLRASIRTLGADLVIRRGDPVAEAIRLARQTGAIGIGCMADYSGFAIRRQRRFERVCEAERIAFRTFAGATVVPPGDVVPSSGGALYRVFTPYYRAWLAKRWRDAVPTPKAISMPVLACGEIPTGPGASPHWQGGETDALRRLTTWTRRSGGYADGHDDLAGDLTSRLSPYLHFGCLSPLRLATAGMPDLYVRQLCWRDFYHQLLAEFPRMPTTNFRPTAADSWLDDPEGLARWKAGETGVDIVDAGMLQLRDEGFMHNRARLVTASYLTTTLGIDWRAGADWFMAHLVDADVANNYGNWQWVAGTGTDTKPYRRFSPTRQAERFDPAGLYVQRYLNRASVGGE